MSPIKQKVICITGPTATGKSDLGVVLAELFDGEIISADSMQVYRGMDVGTAKLTKAEMKGISHHLIDIVAASEKFTVAEWSSRADSVIQSLQNHRRVPFVVGGTGLYIRAITENMDFASESGSSVVRDKWHAYYEEHGKEALYKVLCEVDSVTAQRLHPNDIRRIVRALEVYELRATPLSHTYDWSKKGGRYDTLQLAIEIPRKVLYERVNQRVDKMMEKGLLEEVQALLDSGVDPDAQSMQAIGYKELVSHLQGETGLEAAVDAIKQATRRFVKRQLSWFSRDERIIWLPLPGLGEPEDMVIKVAKEKVKNFLAGIPKGTIE